MKNQYRFTKIVEDFEQQGKIDADTPDHAINLLAGFDISPDLLKYDFISDKTTITMHNCYLEVQPTT